MPSTPPPTSIRARTPPTPLHGPQYDNYEPYSPRRSTRSTAHSNPYSSFNGERDPHGATTPPATVKRARFARAPTQLSSPPSSPASPVKRSALHKTPRKQVFTPRKASAQSSDSDAGPSNPRLAPSNIDPVTMLPTPVKTPKKRQAASLSSARILNFQPNHPNDVMPERKKLKQKQKQRPMGGMDGFDLYDDEPQVQRSGAAIEIYTDTNARVPELDGSEDNPFIGRKKTSARPQRRSRKSGEQLEQDVRIEEAVRRGEGVSYVFRGKKIFRRFQSPADDGGEEDAASDKTPINNRATAREPPQPNLPDNDPSQARLKHQAGASAQRPLTRSALKPRLLFPPTGPTGNSDDIDEEAVTDIEMPNAPSHHSPTKSTPQQQQQQQQGKGNQPVSPPPTTGRVRRGGDEVATPTPVPDGEEDGGSSRTGPGGAAGARKRVSPFDSWQRTKGGRKRAGEDVGGSEGMVKRSRGAGQLESQGL